MVNRILVGIYRTLVYPFIGNLPELNEVYNNLKAIGIEIESVRMKLETEKDYDKRNVLFKELHGLNEQHNRIIKMYPIEKYQ